MVAKTIYTEEKLSELAKSLKAWVNKQYKSKKFGLITDWCLENGFNKTYFHRYIDKSDEFKSAYLLAKAWQEHEVSKGALENRLNARFAQFFLQCHHKWRPNEAVDERLGNLTNDFAKFVQFMEGKKGEESTDLEECE